jgi:hypothetical protein
MDNIETTTGFVRLSGNPEEFKAWSQNLGHDGVLTTFSSYGPIDLDWRWHQAALEFGCMMSINLTPTRSPNSTTCTGVSRWRARAACRRTGS